CVTDALQIPARGTLDNARELEGAFQRTMQDDANTTSTELRSMERVSLDVAGGIPELDGIPSIGTLEPREAHFPPSLAPLEEVGEGAMKTFEGRIDNHGGNIRMLSLAMVLILLIEVHMLACFLIVRDQFLKTGIVHLSRGSQH